MVLGDVSERQVREARVLGDAVDTEGDGMDPGLERVGNLRQLLHDPLLHVLSEGGQEDSSAVVPAPRRTDPHTGGGGERQWCGPPAA